MKNLVLYSLVALTVPLTQAGSSLRNPNRNLDVQPSSDVTNQSEACFKPFYLQGVYNPCPNGEVIVEQCFGDCKPGYSPGPIDRFTFFSSDPNTYCWQDCPNGLQEDGQYCVNPEDNSVPSVCPDDMDWDVKGCKLKLDDRPIVGFGDCIEGFKMNDDDSKCYSTRVPEGVNCNGRFCEGECPEGWTLCENLMCVNATECSADFDDAMTELRHTLKGIYMDKSDDLNGGWLNLADYPSYTSNYTMCSH